MLFRRAGLILALTAVIASLGLAVMAQPAAADDPPIVCTASGDCGPELGGGDMWHCYWIAPLYPGAYWAYVYVMEYEEGGPTPSDPDAIVMCDSGGF